MDNAFSNKINDLVNWSKVAFEHFINEYYADSLTNMRKSGEAICKLIILYQFSEKIANKKIAQKSYNELIELILNEKLAPRKVINWLETIQIHGNVATHDSIVVQEQSYYGIIALRLLIYWIFTEKLNSTVPSELNQLITKIKTNIKDDTKISTIKDERYKLIKEKEELEKALENLKNKDNIEKEKINNLLKELNISENKIKELDIAQQKIKQLEIELNIYKSKLDSTNIDKPLKAETKKKHSKKIIITSLILVLVLISNIMIFKNKIFFSNNISHPETDSTNVQKTDSFRLLILPFTVLQDNPNVKINFEEALISYLSQKAHNNNIPLKIIFNPELKRTSISSSMAFAEGQKEKAFLVLYGELYEPINNDSVQINLKETNIENGKQKDTEFGIQSFSKLSDSSAIRIMQIYDFAVNVSISEIQTRNENYSEALELLYKSKPILKSQKNIYSNNLAFCHNKLKNYDAAIIELKKLIKDDPDNSISYYALGLVYENKNDNINAEINYKKALQINPNDVSTLINYAKVIAKLDSRNYNKSKELLLKAIESDSSFSDSWFYLGLIENEFKNYNSAKTYFLRSLKLDSNNVNIKYQIALILYQNLNETENSINYINQILASDSNNTNALYLLASIYTSSELKNSKKAEYLFNKIKTLEKKDSYSSSFGLGLVAYNKQDFKNALTYFLKSYSENNNDPILSYYIGNSYYILKDYRNAEKYLLKANELDSLNYQTNFNLGNFYYVVEKPYQNLDKARYYFERELKTYPYDTLTLQWLALIYKDKKNIIKTKELVSKLKAITPNSSFVYKMYGSFASLDKDYVNALKYYKKTLEIEPDIDDVISEIATILMLMSPEKNWREALKYAKKAEVLNPGNANNKYNLAIIYTYMGDYQKAAEYYYQSVEMNPENKDLGLEKVFKEKGL